MTSIFCVLLTVGIFAVHFQGSLCAVIPFEGTNGFSEVSHTDEKSNSAEIIAGLINILISNGTTSATKVDGREGRLLVGPGIWCNLPQSLIDAFNQRTVKFLGIFGCTPPLWKQVKKVTKGFWTTSAPTTTL